VKKEIEIRKIFDLALNNHREKNFINAIKYYKKVLKINPSHFDSNYLLGTLYLQNQRFSEAKIKFEKAIKIKPNHAALCNNMGATLVELKEFKEAINFFKKTISIQPNFAQAYNNIGSILKEQEQHREAINYFQKAVELQPGLQEANLNLGIAYKELGKIEKSIFYFKKIIETQPGNIKAHQNLMESYEKTNKEKELKLAILNAKKFIKNIDIIKLYEALVLYNNSKFIDAKNNLESILFDTKDVKNEIIRSTTLAHCYDRINDAKNAFKYFKKANNLYPKLKKINLFDKKRYLQSIKVRTKFFVQNKVKKWKTVESSKNEPTLTFLIGFPRSGTTLLDTILNSHTNIEVIEEKPLVKKLVDSLQKLPKGSLESLGNIKNNELKEIRKIYFDSLELEIKSKNNSNIYIDKLPLNIIHVGEIVRIFPNSKFIFSLRHPYDCVLSCFMQNFVLNDAMANFLDLKDAAHLYDVVMKLWKQYISIFKINYHEVRYESLVENFEPTVRSVLNFLELPWDSSVLEYAELAKKRKNIATPSYNQVTKPIYTHAEGRWKKYKKEISNIYPILDPWIKKFDY
jgi:tetratricopeptide (TPR) repeat protein